MRLPAFTVHRPASLDEAGGLLESLGDDGVVYCGGTELLLVYKLGFADYPALVDVKAIDELRGIDVADGVLRIGASVTHRETELSAVIAEHLPALATMERGVANVRVRNTGTIGGNLCFADPHSDPATFLLAANGSVTCRRAGGAARRMPIGEFMRGPFETALTDGELLVSVEVPALGDGEAMVHRKMSFQERPAITVTVRCRVVGETVSEARVAIGSVGNTPVLATAAAAAVEGVPVTDVHDDEAVLAAAGDAAAEAVDPVEDLNGSIDYKRHLARVLVRRCLGEAVRSAA